MSEVVLDASALLAFLKDEPGGSAVRQLMPTSVMSAVNLAEVATTFIHGGMPADEVERALRELPIRIVPLDEDQAYQASALRPLTADKGLSLGDRCCLALARSLALPALTCDRAWGGLPPDIGVEVQLVR
jgi:PIN domain nuclease of toxin-antitoxin system